MKCVIELFRWIDQLCIRLVAGNILNSMGLEVIGLELALLKEYYILLGFFALNKLKQFFLLFLILRLNFLS